MTYYTSLPFGGFLLTGQGFTDPDKAIAVQDDLNRVMVLNGFPTGQVIAMSEGK